MLKKPNLSHEKQQLARATMTELTYEITKKQLKAIHDSCSNGTSDLLDKKSEPNYLQQRKDKPMLCRNCLTTGRNCLTTGSFNNYRKGNNNTQW